MENIKTLIFSFVSFMHAVIGGQINESSFYYTCFHSYLFSIDFFMNGYFHLNTILKLTDLGVVSISWKRNNA